MVSSFWTQLLEPFGFGTVSKERILRYSHTGGAPCPVNLEEVKPPRRLIENPECVLVIMCAPPHPPKKISRVSVNT